MEALAIIPARGGSKSIPKKNIAELGGRPLIYYAIEAIKKSGIIKKIIVSTEDEEIAEIAKKYGAEVPFMRPKELAEDTTSGRLVADHAVRWVLGNTDFKPEYVLYVQPTSPFVEPKQISELLNLIVSKKADAGITMIPVPRMYHPYHIRRLGKDGFVELNDAEMHYRHPTRQSDPPRYAHGNMWWFKTETFLREGKIEAGKAVGLEIDFMSAWDINDQIDLEIAKCLFAINQRGNL